MPSYLQYYKLVITYLRWVVTRQTGTLSTRWSQMKVKSFRSEWGSRVHIHKVGQDMSTDLGSALLLWHTLCTNKNVVQDIITYYFSHEGKKSIEGLLWCIQAGVRGVPMLGKKHILILLNDINMPFKGQLNSSKAQRWRVLRQGDSIISTSTDWLESCRNRT